MSRPATSYQRALAAHSAHLDKRYYLRQARESLMLARRYRERAYLKCETQHYLECAIAHTRLALRVYRDSRALT